MSGKPLTCFWYTGLTDECEMAFTIKKCAYAADPEVKEHQRIIKADEYDQMVKVKVFL
jgi:hypothetical protein